MGKVGALVAISSKRAIGAIRSYFKLNFKIYIIKMVIVSKEIGFRWFKCFLFSSFWVILLKGLKLFNFFEGGLNKFWGTVKIGQLLKKTNIDSNMKAWSKHSRYFP